MNTLSGLFWRGRIPESVHRIRTVRDSSRREAQPAFVTTWRGEVRERAVRTRRKPGRGKRREPLGARRRTCWIASFTPRVSKHCLPGSPAIRHFSWSEPGSRPWFSRITRHETRITAFFRVLRPSGGENGRLIAHSTKRLIRTVIRHTLRDPNPRPSTSDCHCSNGPGPLLPGFVLACLILVRSSPAVGKIRADGTFTTDAAAGLAPARRRNACFSNFPSALVRAIEQTSQYRLSDL